MVLKHVEVYSDALGKWRWRAKARNGRIVGASEQGYRSRRWATRKAINAYPNETILVLPAVSPVVE